MENGGSDGILRFHELCASGSVGNLRMRISMSEGEHARKEGSWKASRRGYIELYAISAPDDCSLS